MNEGSISPKQYAFMRDITPLVDYSVPAYSSLEFELFAMTRNSKCEGMQITRTSQGAAERRKDIRYRMGASAIFHWEGPGKKHLQGEGITRDISVAGAFVLTPTCPPANIVVKVEVLLSHSEGSPSVLMAADMKVLRVEQGIAQDEQSGFSAIGKGFALRTVSKLRSGPTALGAKRIEGQKQK